MPMVYETLLVTLGPAIAQGILKTWLKDWSLAEDIGSGLVDLLSSHTEDVLAC